MSRFTKYSMTSFWALNITPICVGPRTTTDNDDHDDDTMPLLPILPAQPWWR
jgi:hypothetical protein